MRELSLSQRQPESMNAHLLIRADASAAIGTGHVMRCLALAQAWQDSGGRATFASVEIPPSLAQRLQAEGIAIASIPAPVASTIDSTETAARARSENADWTVVDGYRFLPAYYGALRAAGLQVLAVDDIAHLEHYPVDVLLNQNLNAASERYAGKAEAVNLLLGTRYVLLRREFLRFRDHPRAFAPEVTKILITFGGSDPNNVTAKAIAALGLLQTTNLEAKVVVGSCSEHLVSLESLVAQSNGLFRLERDVRNMPELMAWADLAITAGGSTSWEMAFMGLPALMIVLSKDQEGVADSLQDSGVAQNLGWAYQVSPGQIAAAVQSIGNNAGLRQKMSAEGRRLVDGFGSQRVAQALISYIP
jgi:UDP-2,4-diacetamido-2,4,6-trideoxy-beta-L-altropyranose hydrolase